MPGNLNFSAALDALRGGMCVARAGWNGKGMFLSVQVPDENSKMKKPYIYITPDTDSVIPWVASQADLLAEDWFIIED